MTTYFVSIKNAKSESEAREQVEETLRGLYYIMINEIQPVRSWFRLIGWNVTFTVLGV